MYHVCNLLTVQQNVKSWKKKKLQNYFNPSKSNLNTIKHTCRHWNRCYQAQCDEHVISDGTTEMRQNVEEE